MTKPGWIIITLSFYCAIATCATAGTPDVLSGLSALQRRGKQIYLRGESDSGSVVQAILGNPPMKVSARMLPCANCHGYEGKGIPEGGLVPSNIQWSMLTKSYGLRHESNRRHRPYDLQTLRRAITQGLDPSHNKLGVGMPRFVMGEEDMTALVAYIQYLEFDRDPGVTDTRVRVATLLPLDGSRGAIGKAIRGILEARLEDINASGGIYDRTIELRVVPAAKTPEASIARLNAVLANEEIFALIAPYLPGGEERLADLATEHEIPVIAPMGKPSDDPAGPNRYLFYLSSGLSAQARALVDLSLESQSEPKPLQAVLIHRSDAPFDALASAVREQCRKRNIRLRSLEPYHAETFSPDRLAQQMAGADALFFLGPGDEGRRLLRQAVRHQALPRVYQVGAFLGQELFDYPTAFRGKLWAAFPNSPSVRSGRSMQEYQSFLDRHAVKAGPPAANLGAYCAATLLLESLKSAGRELRREKLIRQLEGLYEFETGLIPPLTYGPNRRVGAFGAYAVSIDLESHELISQNHWIEPME